MPPGTMSDGHTQAANSLDRFLDAQAGGVWEQALAEVSAGRKRSHWIWFVFPQLAGLGRSSTAQFYGLAGAGEARAYAAHPVLGTRLREGVVAVVGWAPRRMPEAIFGDLDAAKLRSCLTVFEAAADQPAIFADALERCYGGIRDPLTLALLRQPSAGSPAG